MQLQMMKKTYGSVESVARNGTKLEMIDGLLAIFVAKLIICNALVYSRKHHNIGQFYFYNILAEKCSNQLAEK